MTFIIIMDELGRIRAVHCLKTDMANVGHRRCRIGVVQWKEHVDVNHGA